MAWGDGVFRCTDGRETFEHLGLEDTHAIGRVVTHPTDPDVAYVAAVGHLWGAVRRMRNAHRFSGFQRTTRTKYARKAVIMPHGNGIPRVTVSSKMFPSLVTRWRVYR